MGQSLEKYRDVKLSYFKNKISIEDPRVSSAVPFVC